MQVIHTIPAQTADDVRRHIRQNLVPLMTRETSRAGNGRLNLWLVAEPIYSTKTYVPGVNDPRLFEYLSKLWPAMDLAQVYGGNVGIGWHRDASYAAPVARILNLGACTLQSKSKDGTLTSLNLTGGEVIEFNSKLLHRCINPSPDRLGVGMWHAKIPITFQNELAV